MTHGKNLESILRCGGILCDNLMRARDDMPTEIGYQDLKARRRAQDVPMSPGGTLGDYVPFYFAPRSPMLYVIHDPNAQRRISVPGGQAGVIYLVTTIAAVRGARVPFLFTDGHPVSHSLSSFYDNALHLNRVDWEVIASHDWANTTDDPDRKRRREAEFLVHKSLPWSLVTEIGVIREKVADRVQEILSNASHQPTVSVRRDWYF